MRQVITMLTSENIFSVIILTIILNLLFGMLTQMHIRTFIWPTIKFKSTLFDPSRMAFQF